MIVDVGDTPTLTWHLRDDDGNPLVPTNVTATLRSPIGVTTSLTLGTDGPGDYAVQPYIGSVGDWLVLWTAIEPGQVEAVAIAAVPPGESAVWAPDLREVASHIPSRTRDVDTNRPIGTFTENTYPNAEIASELIESAVAVVAGMVGRPVVSQAYALCSTATALWSAYQIELSWPERDADISLANRLREDALLLIETAKGVNVAAGGGSEGLPDEDGIPDRLVSFSFPCPGAPLIL